MFETLPSTGAGWVFAQVGSGQSVGEMVVVAVVLYFVYLVVTLVFGGFVLLVAGDRVRRLETRIRQSTLRAVGLGFGGILASVVGFVLLIFIVVLFVELGAPEALGLVLLVPLLVGSLAVLFISVVGEIIAGSWLLGAVKGHSEPNLWVALVVAAVVVNIVYLIPILNVVAGFLLIALPVGGLLDSWWADR